MRALSLAIVFVIGCTEHGEGGPFDGQAPSEGIFDPGLGCFEGNSCTAEAHCETEGHAVCDVPPASGGCDCVNGAFVCFSSCPAGCPEQAPSDGDSCEGVQDAAICPYEDINAPLHRLECRCTAGVFDCN
jgi:hypothetical protein